MKPLTGRREGFALAVALAAIVIIGALIVGVFFASTQEYRVGRNSILQTRALTAAEYGLDAVLQKGTTNGWVRSWNTASPGVLAVRQYVPGDGSVDTVRVTALGHGNFLVVSEGRSGMSVGALGRRRIGALVAMSTAQINIRGALTTRGPTKIGGSSDIDGNDTTFSSWNCPPTTAALPGIAINDTSQISLSGCSGYSCVSGSPPVSQDSVAGKDSTYTQFGDVNWSQLTAMADKTLGNGVTMTGMQPSYNGTTCNTADLYNWGDPYRTLGASAYCADYYPIIYEPGNLTVTGGYGQGILLVQGDLNVSGGFEFYGPVIVMGNLKTTGTGGHFNGGVMASNVDLDQNTFLGDAVVHYSACTVNKAVQGAGTPVLARGRSWVELY